MTSNPVRAKLTVAFNGDLDLISKLAEYPDVGSVFGKLPQDLVGGGRESFLLADMNIKRLKECIDEAHRFGIKFIYLLNATCQSNLELTREHNKKLTAFLSQLVELGVDGFVIATPYMLDLIKDIAPHIHVSVSTFAIINTAKKARIWESRGADRIILFQDVNRDFKVIRQIRQAVNCEIEIFANNMCQYECPFQALHPACKAHASSCACKQKGFSLDYYAYTCAHERLKDPTELIKGRFLRPEDVGFYESLGINVFKLSDRFKSTEWLLRAVRAYSERKFEGSLTDIIAYPYMQGEGEGLISDPKRWMLRPKHVNVKLLEKLQSIGEGREIVSIDNAKLEGFLEFFKKNDCRDFICGEDCRYCHKMADRAVTVDTEALEDRKQKLEGVLGTLVDRSAFGKNKSLVTLSANLGRLASSKKNDFGAKTTVDFGS